MAKLASLIAVIAIAWPVSVLAQPTEQKSPVIVVVGNGSASQAPDYGTFSYRVRGEGKTEVAALQALQASRAKIEGAITHLAGAKHVDITTSELGVSALRGPDCKPDDPVERATAPSQGPCVVIGYLAALRSKVEVAPATKVGNAISLAAQQSAIDATFGEWDVEDMTALRDAAGRDAVTKARREAGLIAGASGLRLGPITRIEDALARGYQDMSSSAAASDASAAAAPASAQAPEVPVDLKPAPVETSATFVITFAIAP